MGIWLSLVDALTAEEFGGGNRWRETRKMMDRDSAQEWDIIKIQAPQVGTSLGGRICSYEQCNEQRLALLEDVGLGD